MSNQDDDDKALDLAQGRGVPLSASTTRSTQQPDIVPLHPSEIPPTPRHSVISQTNTGSSTTGNIYDASPVLPTRRTGTGTAGRIQDASPAIPPRPLHHAPTAPPASPGPSHSPTLGQEEQQEQRRRRQHHDEQRRGSVPLLTTQSRSPKVGWTEKLSSFGSSIPRKLGVENFLPASMERECAKAARILQAFCKEGIYTDAAPTPTHPEPLPPRPPPMNQAAADFKFGLSRTSTQESAAIAASSGAPLLPPNTKPPPPTSGKHPRNRTTILTIPSKVISRAVGLAIFTTVRLGYGATGAAGAGVLIARLPDGRWSPPSGITVYSLGAGLVAGIDLYDGVVVINSLEALEAFKRTRISLGSDMAVVAGPWGAGGHADWTAAPSVDKGKEKERAAYVDVDVLASRTRAMEVGDVNNPRDGGRRGGGTGFATDPATLATLIGTTNMGVAPPHQPYQTDPQPHLDRQMSYSSASGDSKHDPHHHQPGQYKPPPPSALNTLKPVFSYIRSKGLYAGWQVDGTVFSERKDGNANFYGCKGITVAQILGGNVPPSPRGEGWEKHVAPLLEVLRGAEGYRGGAWSRASSSSSLESVWVPPVNYTGPRIGYGSPRASPASPQAVKAYEAGESAHIPRPYSKAQEAADEAAASRRPTGDDRRISAPPSYSEINNLGAAPTVRYRDQQHQVQTDDLPPAYWDGGHGWVSRTNTGRR